MAEFYRKGLMSLAEAANMAKVSYYDMLDYVQKEQIHPPEESDEEIANSITQSKQYFQE